MLPFQAMLRFFQRLAALADDARHDSFFIGRFLGDEQRIDSKTARFRFLFQHFMRGPRVLDANRHDKKNRLITSASQRFRAPLLFRETFQRNRNLLVHRVGVGHPLRCAQSFFDLVKLLIHLIHRPPLARFGICVGELHR